jgi:uncharacterized membrane protein YdbT with pleckstrin-like domain
MSDIISVQPFFTSQKRVSRGFHRLGIFLGLTTVVIFLIIGAQQYDPLSWWIGGVLVALMVYGLARLAGWAINGYTVVFEKAPDGNGGLRFRYELEAKK